MLAGCASITNRAPNVGHGGDEKKAAATEAAAAQKSQRNNEWRPEVHIVKKGETLYSIAFNYGFGYRELADLNGIKNPSAISIGQTIRLFPNKSTTTAGAAAETKAIELLPKEQPKLVKYAYSPAAMALIDKVQQVQPVTTGTESIMPNVIPSSNNTAATVTQENKESKTNENVAGIDDEKEESGLEWGMPTQGKLISQFSESANRKGIDIAGKLGQPILASASGKVVYSGSGLRGYGKLIIIKHNATYLSAYAHNDKILVKEGQGVTRGQKIAVMGNTDASEVKLHFEVRRLGKPVDPAKFLSLGKH